MGQCWPLQMPPTPKAVLISLADNANDRGECYPSVATICKRTCLSERTVQGAIAWLEKHGAVKRSMERGRSTVYTIDPSAYKPPQQLHPRSNRTPAAAAPTPAVTAPPPPQQLHPTPAAAAPRTVREPSIEPSRNRKTRTTLRPVDIGEQVWDDWLSLRRAKRAEVTPTALAGIRREAAKAGWTLHDAIAECCARGWTGFKAEWVGQRPAARASPADERDARLGQWLGQLTGGLAGTPPQPIRNSEIIDVDPDHDGPRRIA